MVVQTVDHARRCVSPEGLQAEIDQLVSQTPRGRAFVRASGTEDVVRVYAEAETQVGCCMSHIILDTSLSQPGLAHQVASVVISVYVTIHTCTPKALFPHARTL